MSLGDFGRVLSELGLGAALACGMFIAFFFLLKWVLKISGEQLAAMQEERKAWNRIQEGFNDQMRGIQDQMKTNILTNKAFYDSVTEAHKFQREEHKEMIQCLGRINGYKTH